VPPQPGQGWSGESTSSTGAYSLTEWRTGANG
jgi:hypothetical protein